MYQTDCRLELLPQVAAAPAVDAEAVLEPADGTVIQWAGILHWRRKQKDRSSDCYRLPQEFDNSDLSWEPQKTRFSSDVYADYFERIYYQDPVVLE